MSNKKFFVWIYWKLFCHFWPIKLNDLSHIIQVAPIFPKIYMLLSFLSWYEFKIQIKSRGRGTFLCLVYCLLTFGRSCFFLNWKLNVPCFIFLICRKQFWIWFSQKLTKTSKFLLSFKVILILPPVWLLNLGSDLSINNIVQLDLADTKIVSQDAVNKVLELTEKWKYPNFRGKF